MLHAFDEFIGRLKGFIDYGNGRGSAVCPCDDTHDVTFAVGHEGQLVIRCDPRTREGSPCTALMIVRRVGVDPLSLQPGRDRTMASDKGKATEEAVHQYHDQDSSGNWYLAYEVLRLRYADGSKEMPQRVPNPQFDSKKAVNNANKRHLYGLNGQRPVLYRVKQLREGLKAGPTRWVFVQEGEVKVEMCHELSLLATCCPMGALKWNKPWYKTELTNANVIVIPDEDMADAKGEARGLEHAKQVIRDLTGTAHTIRLVRMPDPEFPGYGFEDWRRKQKGKPAEVTAALMELVKKFPDINDLKQLDALKPHPFPVAEAVPPPVPPPPPAADKGASGQSQASAPAAATGDAGLKELGSILRALNASSQPPRSNFEWLGEIVAARQKFERLFDVTNANLIREAALNYAAAIVRGCR